MQIIRLLARQWRARVSRAWRGVKTRRQFRVSLGNGLSEVDAFYNPKRRHAIELRLDEIVKREEDDDGDDDGDGGTKPSVRQSGAG